MLQTDTITVGLRLDGLLVLDMAESQDCIEIAAACASAVATCPRCARVSGKVHDRRRQRKRDLELWDKPVWIHLWKRRFRWLHCRRVFTEEDPARGRSIAPAGQNTPCRRYRPGSNTPKPASCFPSGE